MNGYHMHINEAGRTAKGYQEEIVLITINHIAPRICKIGWALRNNGFKVILLHGCNPTIYIPEMSNFFDEAYAFYSNAHALEIARHFTPLAYHIFASWNCDLAELFIRSRPGKIVFDNYDIVSGQFSTDFIDTNYPGLDEKERFCFENADGVVCRSLELHHVRKKLQLQLKGKIILFLDYCWNNQLPDSSQLVQDGIHIVYAGSVILEKDYPPDTEHEAFYLDFSKRITSFGIHFHLYPNPARCNNFEEQFSDFFELEAKNPFFHIHHPVPSNQLGYDLSKYDAGLMTSSKTIIEQGTEEYYPTRAQLGMPHKIFDYIDAGLGVIIGKGYDFSRQILKRRGIGITSYLEGLEEKILSLSQDDWANIKKNAREARSALSVETQIPRLISFYFSLHAQGETSISEKGNHLMQAYGLFKDGDISGSLNEIQKELYLYPDNEEARRFIKTLHILALKS